MRISGLGGRESICSKAQTKQMTFIDLIAAQAAGHSSCGSPSALTQLGSSLSDRPLRALVYASRAAHTW